MKRLRIIYSAILILLIAGRIFMYEYNCIKVYKAVEQTRKFSITASICTQVEETDKSYTAYARVKDIKPKINIDKISLIIPKNKVSGLKYGEVISFVCKLEIPDSELNDGGFSYRDYLKTKNVTLTANFADKINSKNKIYKSGTDKGFFVKLQTRVNNLQSACIRHLEKYFGGDNLALIKAIITGDRENITNEMTQAYINSGTYHIVAVSGLHTSVLICFAAFPLLFIRAKRQTKQRTRNIIAIITATFLLIFTGYGVSVYKVLFMSFVVVVATLGKRKYNAVHALIYSLFGILICMPYKIGDAGLWLSVSSTYGILVSDRVKAYLDERFPKTFHTGDIDAFLGGLLSAVYALPFCVYYFSRVSILSPISNIVIVPLSSVLVICSAIFSVTGFMPKEVCSALAHIPNLIALLINKITKAVAEIPFSSIYVSSSVFFTLSAAGIICALIYIAYKKRRKRICTIMTSIALIVSVAVSCISFGCHKMFINVLNTENGSCSIVTVKSGINTKYYMFDCGSENNSNMAEDIVIPYMSKKGISKINTLFLSYTGTAYANGVNTLIKNNMIKNIVIYDTDSFNNKDADALRRIIIQNANINNVNIKYVTNGERLNYKDFEVEVINNSESSAFKADNAADLYKIKYGNTSTIMCGGAGLRALNSLSKTDGLRCDLLVMTKNDFNLALNRFTDACKPEYIAISSGKGADKKLKNRFEEDNINLNQTIYDKSITYESNGNTLKLKKVKGDKF